MRRALLFTGAGLMVAAAGLPSFAAPKQTARTVTNGFVRSNVLLPLGGKKAVSNPVPEDLSDLSGWTREELEVGLEKQYDVDVADVTRFLYGTEQRITHPDPTVFEAWGFVSEESPVRQLTLIPDLQN